MLKLRLPIMNRLCKPTKNNIHLNSFVVKWLIHLWIRLIMKLNERSTLLSNLLTYDYNLINPTCTLNNFLSVHSENTKWLEIASKLAEVYKKNDEALKVWPMWITDHWLYSSPAGMAYRLYSPTNVAPQFL